MSVLISEVVNWYITTVKSSDAGQDVELAFFVHAAESLSQP